MNGVADFVPGGYPLPWNPITLGDFTPGWFPLPQNPVGFRPSANGTLPKAPDIPMALIGHGNGKSLGCGGDCGCDDCSGMGRVPNYVRSLLNASSTGLEHRHAHGYTGMGGLGDTIIPQASLPTFLQGETFGFPTVYVAGVGVLALIMFMGSRGGRRRR
jgi:hypothetical protein